MINEDGNKAVKTLKVKGRRIAIQTDSIRVTSPIVIEQLSLCEGRGHGGMKIPAQQWQRHPRLMYEAERLMRREEEEEEAVWQLRLIDRSWRRA